MVDGVPVPVSGTGPGISVACYAVVMGCVAERRTTLAPSATGVGVEALDVRGVAIPLDGVLVPRIIRAGLKTTSTNTT